MRLLMKSPRFAARSAACRPAAVRPSALRAACCALAISVLAPFSLLSSQEPAQQRAATSLPGGAFPIDRIAAVVGSTAILTSDIEAAIAAQQIPAPPDSAAREKLRRDVLEQLIDMEVVVQRAKLDTTILVDEGEIATMAEEQIKQIRGNFPTDQAYRDALVEAGFGTPDEYRSRQLDDLRRRQLQESYMAALRRNGKLVTVNVSEREVNEELAAYEGKLPERPATVGFQQIVIPTAAGEESRTRARALIDSLYQELRDKPTGFEEAARQFSEDGSAANGGDLGWNRRGVMVPEFDRVMFMINPGIVSPPVESRFGWHLIRVDRVQPAEVKARHILIRAAVDSSDEDRARLLADSVRAMWEQGITFDSLRARYHDERGGEDAIIPEVRTTDLPEAYGTAIGTSGRDQIVGPFPIPDPSAGANKWVVLKLSRVTPAGPMSMDEARRDMRARMQQAYSLRRMLDVMRKETYVSIRL